MHALFLFGLFLGICAVAYHYQVYFYEYNITDNIATNCALCNLLIKRTKKYLFCKKFKNNIHYVYTSLLSEELEKIYQKNWVCYICVPSGIVDNNSNIMELFQQIRDSQKSL